MSLGQTIFPLPLVQECKIRKVEKSIGMIRTQYAAPDFEGLAEERFRLGVLALVGVDAREIAHGPQREGMLRPQYAATDFQDLAVERLRLRTLALVLVVDSQIVHGSQREGMLRP